jgi:cell division protein ZapA
MTVDQIRHQSEFVMAQVTVIINGRQFRLACEEGQEGHLKHLAEELDRRIGDLRTQFGEIGDTRLTVMAALMVTDEVAESGTRLRKLQEEMASLSEARVASAEHALATQAAIVAALNSAAERIEKLTRQLNQTVGDGTIVLS